MPVAEHDFSHMLRHSGDVLAEVKHRDVVLRRRDGADLILGLRSRAESVREALGVMAQLLVAVSIDAATRERAAAALAAALPWASFLPSDERAEFFEALTAQAAACVEIGAFEPLGRLIEGWRTTAEIYAAPELLHKLEDQHISPPVPLMRPDPT